MYFGHVQGIWLNWAWLPRGVPWLGSRSPSKVRSPVLVCWSTAISKPSFTKIHGEPPPPLSKVFDTICHSKLLYKVQNYKTRGSCLNLIKSYLCSHQQITKFNDIKSETETILFGVRQGYVLGPLLFLFYINDIIHSTNQGEFVIFADDTNK